jgi:hypothetical protein
MRRSLFLASVLAVVGCGDSTGPAPAATLDGTYDLVSVNGAPLPFTIANGSIGMDELLSDVITASNGTVSETTLLVNTSGESTTNEIFFRSGTYTINGSAITLELIGVVPVTGTGMASGRTLILPIRGQIPGEARYVHR